VEQYLIILLVGILLLWGWGFAKRQLTKHEDYCLYLVVKNQEDCLEGIIRHLFRYLHRQEAFLRLYLVVEKSEDQTLAIAQRLGRCYSFEVIPIQDLEQWLAGSPLTGGSKKLLLDLRNRNQGWPQPASYWTK